MTSTQKCVVFGSLLVLAVFQLYALHLLDELAHTVLRIVKTIELLSQR